MIAAQKPIALPNKKINAGSNKTNADSNKPARNVISTYASGCRSLIIACDERKIVLLPNLCVTQANAIEAI